MSGEGSRSTRERPLRRIVIDDDDLEDDNDAEYQPSDSVATQSTREGTAATEESLESGDEEVTFMDMETAAELLSELYGEDDDEDGEGGEYEIVYEEGGDEDEDYWMDDEEAAQQVRALVGDSFRVRLPARGRPKDLKRENLEPIPSLEGQELMSGGDFGFYEFSARSPKRQRRDSNTSSQSPTTPRSPQLSRSPRASRSPQLSRSPEAPRSPTGTSNTGYRPAVKFPNDSCLRRKTPISQRLLMREMGIRTGEPARIADSLVAQSMIPTSTDKVIHFSSRCYSGQFSEDGNFFYCCSQDMVVRMYDTSNPYEWRYYRSATYPGGYWTITDACLSPDNRQLAYCSLDSCVYMAKTQTDEEDELTILDFSNGPMRTSMRNGTPIWSIRFSGDGKEMVAGAKDDTLYVYDIEKQRSILKLEGHTNDVNAVCYGDKNSPHILFSGSDDSTIKVWDRRSMASGREAGAFIGHMEGITYIDAKGDGRYVLSNSKDQSMKLWDIRKMSDSSAYDKTGIRNYSSHDFDYRYQTYDHKPIRRHPQDNSVVTFRGHRVLKTLIRCHFSPPNSSGSRYVYSGSEDGRVFIYNLDATIAGVIDVQQSTYDSQPRPSLHSSWRGLGLYRGRPPSWDTTTRDASWHPTAPIIVSTSWNGYGGEQGSVAIHGWDGKVRGEGMTREDFGYWNPNRKGLRENFKEDKEDDNDADGMNPIRVNEHLQPLRRRRDIIA